MGSEADTLRAISYRLIHEAGAHGMTALEVAALSAHNLPAVAAMVRAKRPDLQIIIAADDDAAGMKAARIAAEQTGATLALPEIYS